jgi:hypothetical protein
LRLWGSIAINRGGVGSAPSRLKPQTVYVESP